MMWFLGLMMRNEAELVGDLQEGERVSVCITFRGVATDKGRM